jgi:PTS system mannose-specific IIB component
MLRKAMSIVLVRIDDRLVHGQIVQGWLKTIVVNTLLVVSDLVVSNKMQQMLMAMAVPRTIKLDVKTLSDATKAIVNRRYDKDKVMVLLVHPSDALYMIENGVEFKSLNVGGMHFIKGKRQLLYNIYVNDEDIKSLYKIHGRGVEIEGRVLPGDERANIASVIEKEYLAMCRAGES